MLDTLQSRIEESDRAVSPVIGVILMVAITVILAAVIGTFVLDLGSDVNENPRAGVSFDQTNSSTVDVTLTTLGNLRAAGDISFSSNGACNAASAGFSNVGDTATIDGCDPGDRISVLGELGGENSTIATYQIK